MPRCRAIAIVIATSLGVLLSGLRHDNLHAQFPEQIPESVPDFAAGLTPEQFASGNEFLDDFGWMFWSLAEGILVIEEPEEMAEVDQSELDQNIESAFEEIRPRIKAQMLFLRKTANLTDEQFQVISECGEHEVTMALRRYFLRTMQPVFENQVVDERGEVCLISVTAASMSLPVLIHETLVTFAKSQITDSQLQQYEIELAARQAHRKRVTILNVVARLDADLLLLPEQRVQFTKLMESEWQDSWGESLSALMPDTDFVPALPDANVLAILKDYQQAIWKTKNYNREWNEWDDDPIGLLHEDEEMDVDMDEMKPEEDDAAKPLANRE